MVNYTVQTTSITSLPTPLSQSVPVSVFLTEFRNSLSSTVAPVLLSDSMSLTLTTGSGSNGDEWKFEVITVATELKAIKLIRNYSIRYLNAQYNLSDYKVQLSQFSIVRRSASIDQTTGRNSPILVLPDLIRRAVLKKISKGAPVSEPDIEHLQCLLLEALTGNTSCNSIYAQTENQFLFQ